ncbi:MAG: prepilin-type N-terminal cleavage/methylation domain-containing protein [Selenomonadaceae bacterium]|nr:prepilin-type N-terminal cleavage/methylation domain-containing protein [Selenomonadaceae bacterium]
MQKGFASLELIFAVLIISILATVAVPKAANFVDRAALDYEKKRLYSELQYLRTLSRTITVDSTGMHMPSFFSSKITVNQPALFDINRDTNSYRILRENKSIREVHYFSNGVKFSKETDVPTRIFFDAAGYSNVKSKSIVLTSRRGVKAKIIFDSVGRIRGE